MEDRADIFAFFKKIDSIRTKDNINNTSVLEFPIPDLSDQIKFLKENMDLLRAGNQVTLSEKDALMTEAILCSVLGARMLMR